MKPSREGMFRVIEAGFEREGRLDDKAKALIARAKAIYIDPMLEITCNDWKKKYPDL